MEIYYFTPLFSCSLGFIFSKKIVIISNYLPTAFGSPNKMSVTANTRSGTEKQNNILKLCQLVNNLTTILYNIYCKNCLFIEFSISKPLSNHKNCDIFGRFKSHLAKPSGKHLHHERIRLLQNPWDEVCQVLLFVTFTFLNPSRRRIYETNQDYFALGPFRAPILLRSVCLLMLCMFCITFQVTQKIFDL